MQTLTFKTLYVLVFIAHGRRELVHLNVTAHPTAAWVWRQLVEATAWGRRPRFLLRDRDAVYGGDFARARRGAGHRDPAHARAGPAGEGRRFILHLRRPGCVRVHAHSSALGGYRPALVRRSGDFG